MEGRPSKELSKTGGRGGRGSKHERGEQMQPCLEMTDCASLRHHQTEQTKATLRSWKSAGGWTGQAGAPGLTHRSCFALSCGSAAVCKVEKKPRKTKVCESPNPPVGREPPAGKSAFVHKAAFLLFPRFFRRGG